MKGNNRQLIFAIIIIDSILLFLLDDIDTLAKIYFYLLLLFIGTNVFYEKKIDLITTWCTAFLFIILSEVFVYSSSLSNDNAISAIKFLMLSNNLVVFGYFFQKERSITTAMKTVTLLRTRKFSLEIIIITSVIYVLLVYPSAIISFTSGRTARFEIYTGAFERTFRAVAFVMPAIITYYYVIVQKRKVIVPLLFSLPYFIILFLLGSRFPLLFSIGGFILVLNSTKIQFSNRYILLIIVFVISLSVMSLYIKDARSIGNLRTYSKELTLNSFPTYVSEFMSPENVVYHNTKLMKHFDDEGYLYGYSTSFILYFWIPRTIWPDKPTMLGHWFVREYASVNIYHNVSYGFTGELYSDFGYFSLILLFFIGVLLRRAEMFKNSVFATGGYEVIIGAMFYPFVFFFVRSPLTSSINLIIIIGFYLLYKKLLFKKTVLTKFG